MLILFYIVTDLLSNLILWKITSGKKRVVRFSAIGFNILLSAFTILFAIKYRLLGDEYATPEGIMDNLHLNLGLFLTMLPRTILVALHFAGVLIRIRHHGYIKALTLTGIIIWSLILYMGAYGYFIGRFNFRYEEVDVHIPDLHPDLDGFRIVQISDLHLGSFHGSSGKIVEMVDKINALEPDLILNTGDFITLGTREFGDIDTILKRNISRYGNYAIIGNHDIGTYLRSATESEIQKTTADVSRLIVKSGYILLNRENDIINVGNSRVAIIGAETRGRHPLIIHPQLDEALKGTIDADIRILMTHDPNHWEQVIADTPGIELTLSGHTHGMQFGYLGKRIKWSPAQYIFPRWYGLYTSGDMNLYVNRGVGVLGIPVRFGMPPEVTILTLRK